MDTRLVVLVTGVGAPGTFGTLYSLSNNPLNIEIRIIGTDLDSEAVGKYFVDTFYTLPEPEDEWRYIEKLLSICKKNQVKVVLPQTTKEIETLSKYKNLLEENGIKAIVSEHKSVSLANNKCKLLRICKENNILHPQFEIVSSWEELKTRVYNFNYPTNSVVIKPCFSNGLRGVRILTKEHLSPRKFFDEKPNGLFITLEELGKILKGNFEQKLIVQEFLPGDEYSVDVLRWRDKIISIPRRRLKIRSGISFHNIIEKNDEIINLSNELAKLLNLEYCFGFQFKLDKNGVPKILECNPRVQGTMVASTFAGFNIIFYSVLLAIDEKKGLEILKRAEARIKWGTEFKRYWGGIGISENNAVIGRI